MTHDGQSAALLRALIALALATASHGWWRHEETISRGKAPYPCEFFCVLLLRCWQLLVLPASCQPGTRLRLTTGTRCTDPASHADGTGPVYDVVNEKTGPQEGKINVHLVPHTHDDTGWLVTVDQYFFSEVYYIVDTVVDQLAKNPNRHFIYVEVGFFARWWDEQLDDRRNLTRSLVANGQLEFINGAWCMHDEAAPFYTEMIDQTTRGHQFLKKNFGDDAIPRGTWQVDPFGHSNTQAWLLGSEAGFDSLFWGRSDYQDMTWRTSAKGKAKNQYPEWLWQGSQSLGKSAELFAGQLLIRRYTYSSPIAWDYQADKGPGRGPVARFESPGSAGIQDDPSRHDYNVDEMVDSFIATAVSLSEDHNVGRLGHQLWPCGSDFQYQNADHWFHNLDKIIHYVNYNASKGGPVVAFCESD
jgi:alpha-mannosidase